MLDWAKGVSRSFYLSLRLLPGPLREPVALAYLLARTTDTLADHVRRPATERLAALASFGAAIAGEAPPPRWDPALLGAVPDAAERSLLERGGLLLAALWQQPAEQARLIREVLATILSGQSADLTRFGTADAARPVALPDDAALTDYAWRVAGCVGEFWTRMGALTLGDRFSSATTTELLPVARDYGTALQLVNILRDLPADLAQGRCYLPVPDPCDHAALLGCHAHWVSRARDLLAGARGYAATLYDRRLRAASLLPALLAQDTLALLDGADWNTLAARVKVPRRRVYAHLLRALCAGHRP